MEVPVKVKEEPSEASSLDPVRYPWIPGGKTEKFVQDLHDIFTTEDIKHLEVIKEPRRELEAKDWTSSPQECEEKLTPITEVIIKEESCTPTLDNLLLITKKEESLENYEEQPAEQEEEKLFQPDVTEEASDKLADISCKETENNQDRSCEDQTRSSKVLSPSKCHDCKRMFSTVTELLQHQEVHIPAKKRLQCPVCLRVFAHASNLSRHKYVHTGVKNYVCKFCDKKFSQKSNLNQHETIHTGERPYSCQYCSRTFTWEPNLNQHIQAHHRNRADPYVVSDMFPEKEKFPCNMLHHTGNSM